MENSKRRLTKRVNKEVDEKDIMKRLQTVSRKKDSLIKEKTKLEVEKENLQEELTALQDEVKEEFGTLDSKELDTKKQELLEEADQLLKEIGDI